jgi:sn-glycerol 3-phosphate transport system ATP-binding protein
VRRTPAAERSERLARVAELLGLTPLLARKPSQLSGGQQQRVALGRAIIAQAPVCLMDEPLSNLDAQLRAEMRLEIRALQRKLGVTMVYVTHDQVEAMSMADRVVLMREGRIEQNGAPVDLYENPANTFVARFIGTPPMNLLRLSAGRDGAVIAGTEGPVVLDTRFAPGMLGVRPEHIEVGFERGVPASVDNVEYLGGDSLVSCRVGGQPRAARVQGSVGLTRGDAVWLRWSAGAQHYFEAQGSRAVSEAHESRMTLLA